MVGNPDKDRISHICRIKPQHYTGVLLSMGTKAAREQHMAPQTNCFWNPFAGRVFAQSEIPIAPAHASLWQVDGAGEIGQGLCCNTVQIGPTI